jgi:hypothetical protein
VASKCQEGSKGFSGIHPIGGADSVKKRFELVQQTQDGVAALSAVLNTTRNRLTAWITEFFDSSVLWALLDKRTKTNSCSAAVRFIPVPKRLVTF